MAISTNCDRCSAKFRLPDELSGKQVQCQRCSHVFVAPAPDPVMLAAPVESDPPQLAEAVAEKPRAAPMPPLMTTDGKSPAKRRDREDPGDDDRPRRRQRGTATPSKSRSGAGAGMIVSAAVLFLVLVGIGAGVGLWAVTRRNVPPAPPVVAEKPPAWMEPKIEKKFDERPPWQKEPKLETKKDEPKKDEPKFEPKFEEKNPEVKNPEVKKSVNPFEDMLRATIDDSGAYSNSQTISYALPRFQGQPGRAYAVELEKGRSYRFKVSSQQILPWLIVLDRNNHVLVQDTVGKTSVAEVRWSATYSGEYRVFVGTAEQNGKGGSYDFLIVRSPDGVVKKKTEPILGENGRDPFEGMDDVNFNTRGAFTSRQQIGRDAARFQKQPGHAFAVDLVAGRTYTFDLASSDFVPSLLLLDQKYKVLARSTGAQGKPARIVWTAKAKGRHHVFATMSEPYTTGGYVLDIFRGAVRDDQKVEEKKVEDPKVEEKKVEEKKAGDPPAMDAAWTIREVKLPKLPRSLLPIQPVWDEKGEHFFVVAEDNHVLRVRASDFEVVAQSKDKNLFWSSLAWCSEGLIGIQLGKNRRVSYLDEATLQVVRHFEIDSDGKAASYVVASRRLPTVFIYESGRSFVGVLDLKEQRWVARGIENHSEKLDRVRNAVMSNDGRDILAYIGTDAAPQLLHLRFADGKLTRVQSQGSTRSGSNTLDLSADGAVVACSARTSSDPGVARPKGALLSLNDLKSPLPFSSRNNLRTIRFDLLGGMYVQAYDSPLRYFRNVPPRDDDDGELLPWEEGGVYTVVPRPRQRAALVLVQSNRTGKTVFRQFYVESSAKAAVEKKPADPPMAAKKEPATGEVTAVFDGKDRFTDENVLGQDDGLGLRGKPHRVYVVPMEAGRT
jgi:predicted Zn finger-like uncharacterized protein